MKKILSWIRIITSSVLTYCIIAIDRLSMALFIGVELPSIHYNRGIDEIIDTSTDEEAQAALNIDGNTMRPTRGSLVKDGYLIDTGTTRKNAKGHECIVWRTAEQDMLL